MGFLNSSHHSGDSYYLIKAASKAYAEEQEQKRKQREGIQPAAQRLRHAAQQQFYLENKRRMGYKDSSKKKDPYIDPPHESNSNHDSNVNKSKPQAQSKSTYQPSMSRTTTKTMDDPPPYDPSPQAQSQSTHQPSTSRTTTKTMDDPPPYDQSPPCEMQVDAPALFLQRIIASSLETPHLLYALLASACSHHSRLVQDTGPKSRVSCLRFTNLSISSLRSALSETNATLTAETVTTAMALCTNDVCNGNMQTWRTHLGGVMRLLGAFLDSQGTPRIADPYIQCLVKWFTTMDVLAGLSGLSTSGVMGSDTGLLDRSFDQLNPHVDDICGYSLQLAPLLARLSQLVQRQCHTGPAMQEDVLEESRRLETEILSLVECSVSGGNSLELQSTHLAFVHSALLLLHRRVQTLPSNRETVKEDIGKVIAAVGKIPPFSSANILILWPMFSVGCETDDTKEREFIHKRMGDMQSLGMGNFTRARELLSRFWASETSLSWDTYFSNLGYELVLF
ncbi:hypothetical protein N7527_005418 [Penicillium freii]|nr:hypothetical protein N7527_005418 [Penicillium freii]